MSKEIKSGLILYDVCFQLFLVHHVFTRSKIIHHAEITKGARKLRYSVNYYGGYYIYQIFKLLMSSILLNRQRKARNILQEVMQSISISLVCATIMGSCLNRVCR